jgi:hypothetical protein
MGFQKNITIFILLKKKKFFLLEQKKFFLLELNFCSSKIFLARAKFFFTLKPILKASKQLVWSKET